MPSPEEPLGGTGLLRVAGLPIRYWLQAANPSLFARIRTLDRKQARHLASGPALADRIGRELVPHPGLGRDDRATLLAVRRKLHNGNPVGERNYQVALRLAAAGSGADSRLVADLAAAADRERALDQLTVELDGALAGEERRLHALPRAVLAESAVAAAILSDQPDPQPRAGAGKQDRKRSGYQWRCLTRAATGTTPRDWLSHVALLPVTAHAAAEVRLAPGFAAQWRENVCATGSRSPGEPATGARMAANPLHWTEAGHRVFVVPDPGRHLARVSVRDTPLLAAVLAALAGGARTVADLAAAVPAADQAALPGFVQHLLTLGVLEPATVPRAHLVRRAVPGHTFADHRGTGRATARDGAGMDGWVDVYRSAPSGPPGGLPAGRCAAIQDGVILALRFLALVDPPPALAAPSPERSVPFDEVLRASLTAQADPAATTRPDPPPAVPADRRLIRALADRVGRARKLDLDATLLDALGAPPARLGWPVDCLLRAPAPGAGYAAVLDQIRPPGTVDARFADALSDLHGQVPQVEAYRRFLRRLEEATGYLFVELLVPPIVDGSANAVRRPAYTRAWAGDPNPHRYLPSGADPGHYVPFSAIRLRRAGGRLWAEAGGRPIWPVYHATREILPPWDRPAKLLLAAAPRVGQPGYRRLADPFRLFPRRRAAPRITTDAVVLSPAAWQVAPRELGELRDLGTPLAARVRALARLREQRRLPRWIRVRAAGSRGPSQPCDLESLPALRTLERLGRTGAALRVVEMLPTPEELLVTDSAHRPGDRLVSELLLRLPWDETPTALADRLAPGILASRTGAGMEIHNEGR